MTKSFLGARTGGFAEQLKTEPVRQYFMRINGVNTVNPEVFSKVNDGNISKKQNFLSL